MLEKRELDYEYIYDDWNLIAEYIEEPVVGLALRANKTSSSYYYVWGLDISGSLQGAGGVGGLLAVDMDNQLYHPAYDANGNVTEYVDASGNIVAHYEYSPFGETVVQSGDLADSFSFRFSTKYFEEESEQYYYGYRYYSPSMGRWLNRDLIDDYAFIFLEHIDIENLLNVVYSQENEGFIYSYNPLQFIYNNPLNFMDYIGLMALDSVSAYINNCLKLPTIKARIACLEPLLACASNPEPIKKQLHIKINSRKLQKS